MSAGPYQSGQLVRGTNLSVLRQIGSGGTSDVYEVEELSIGRVYVLKVVHPNLARAGRGRLAERMIREAQVLAQFEHEHIVQVFWAGRTHDDERLPFYVMERLNGQTLRRLMASAQASRSVLPLGFALDVMLDLLDALAYAHARKIIHRDVKPENVFLHRKASGEVVTKLLDFGILAMVSEDREQTSTGFKGTLRYAAPEQIRGERPSPQGDLYSAALVLFEMLAGRGPFDDLGDGVAIAAAHLRDHAPELGRFRPVPAALEALLSRALRKDPGERPAGAREFGDELRAIREALDPADGALEPDCLDALPFVATGTVTTGQSSEASQTLQAWSASESLQPFPDARRPVSEGSSLGPVSAGRRRGWKRFSWLAAAIALGLAGLFGAARVGWVSETRPSPHAAAPRALPPSAGASPSPSPSVDRANRVAPDAPTQPPAAKHPAPGVNAAGPAPSAVVRARVPASAAHTYDPYANP